jgi:hypothetical protein
MFEPSLIPFLEFTDPWFYTNSNGLQFKKSIISSIHTRDPAGFQGGGQPSGAPRFFLEDVPNSAPPSAGLELTVHPYHSS